MSICFGTMGFAGSQAAAALPTKTGKVVTLARLDRDMAMTARHCIERKAI